MDIQELIALIFVFGISAVCAVISVRSFMQKGFLFNNAWIWADSETRKRMDKRPHYKQSAIVFLLLTVVFAAAGINLITKNDFFFGVSAGVTIAAVIYAVVSSVRTEKKK